MSRSRLAKRCGLNPHYIYLVETGRRNFSPDAEQKISKAMNITAKHLHEVANGRQSRSQTRIVALLGQIESLIPDEKKEDLQRLKNRFLTS